MTFTRFKGSWRTEKHTACFFYSESGPEKENNVQILTKDCLLLYP